MSKYPRTFHCSFSPGGTNDDRISDSLDFLLNTEIVITEKLDGENTGMTNKGVYARSHAAPTISPWSKEIRILHDVLKHSLDDELFLFGESVEGIHSIEYSKLTSYFYLFGIREGTTWGSWKDVEDAALVFDLPTVPVLFKGVINSEKELKEIVEYLVHQESKLGGLCEGCVIRNADRFEEQDFSTNVLKWVRKDHVQCGEHWTRTWKKAKLINRF